MNRIIQEDIASILNASYPWETFRDSTVLITGASGMLASYMVLTLLELNKQLHINCKVLAMARNSEKLADIFKGYSEFDGLYVFSHDVSIPFHYNGNIDYVIHAASQASPLYYGVDPVGTLRANVMGTLNLLDMAIEKKVKRFLFFSSSMVYGNFTDESIVIKESDMGFVDPLNIRSCYSESKKMGENMCASYAYQYGLEALSVRVFHTLGPNMNIHDGRAFSDFVKCVVEEDDIVLRSDGSALRTYCYITDAVRAYFLLLLRGEKGMAYNVGGDTNHEISVLELARMLTRMYGEKKLKVVFDIDENNLTYGKMKCAVSRIIPDLSAINKLGWRQTISIEDTFRRTIDAKQEK